MELIPDDLGEYWRIALFRYRAMGASRVHTPPNQGFLGKFWASRSDVSEQVASATLPMMADTTLPLIALPSVVIPLVTIALFWFVRMSIPMTAVVLLSGASILYFCLLYEPRRRFGSLHQQKVRLEEIQALKGGRTRREILPVEESQGKWRKAFQSVRGKRPLTPGQPLEQDFLSLVQNALIIRDLPVQVETEIRRILPALGETVILLTKWRLYAQDYAIATEGQDQVIRDNVGRLTQRAENLEAMLQNLLPALGETLPVVADSAGSSTAYPRYTVLIAEVQSIINETASLSEVRAQIEPSHSIVTTNLQSVGRSEI